MKKFPFLLLTVGLAACKAPPEAPAAFDDLCAWLFEHHADADPEAETLGLAELDGWLNEHLAETAEGQGISPLTEATVDSLDGQDRRADGMLGIAVATASIHGADDAAAAMIAEGRDALYPGDYTDYSRTVDGDLACFLARDCLRLETDEEMVAEFLFGVTSTSQAHTQLLWVELETGWALVTRNWLLAPPDVNFDWLNVDEQFNLDLLLPAGSGSRRLQATWMVFQQDDVSEDMALSMAVTALQDNATDLDAWLDSGQQE